MDRVFESGAIGSAPSAPASPSSGYPTAGNPSTGTVATKPGAYWFHQVTEELRKAITDAGITPNHADLTQLSAAISALAKKGGLQSAGMVLLTTNTTLTNADHLGKTILFDGTATGVFTVTLPLINTVAPSRRIHFHNVSSFNVTVQRQGSNVIYPNGASVNSIVVGPGDNLTLEAYNATSWIALGGSSQLGASAVFGSQKNANGYQKLPGGLILQWTNVMTNSNGIGTISWPIAFPNACLHHVGTLVGAGVVLPWSAILGAPGQGGSTALVCNASGVGQVASVAIFAIGH